ncbi:NCS2 family permease [Synechococcus sp. BSF8S]|uniref:NCS2 family permease n=1 Tax=Synechococcales TaxID=1890424 RepID=UPI0016294BE9|nr:MULTISPECIES: NCS2 family permease [unclassified Synechococcus]MBC1262117.1 NCS2 family permease [Synechococcus sp. BSF8S]MBC1265044.1 NCS2 family permease [Synechococcus sp. BSA11S]
MQETGPRWLVPGDWDGLLGLGLDNLIQILLILGLCRGVLGYPDALIFGVILPATGVSLVVGNAAYAWQAHRLGQREGRADRTALPYGINTVSLFAYVFLVMLPVKLTAVGQGLSDAEAVRLSWQAGMMACLGSGLIETSGAWCVGALRRWLPRAALLSTLAGIALGYIALGFLLRTYAQPVVGLAVLAVILLTYYGNLRLPLPGGLLAVLLGIALAATTGLLRLDPISWQANATQVGWHLPSPRLGALWQARDQLLPWIGVIVPMGLFNVLGSLQNLESAEAAGDRYPVKGSLLINGVGTVAAALLGSCFPTTIYIGHPGWKGMGARIGYSWLNGMVMGLGCLFGLFGLVGQLVPIEAGMAIVLYIGIVIAAQSFQATPAAHAPAVVLGMLPGLAGWGALLLKAGLRAGGTGGTGPPFGPAVLLPLQQADVWAAGAFALEQGQIVAAMLLSALLVYVIEQRFLAASACAALACVGSWFGLIHAWRFTPADTALNLGWGTGADWALGYLAMAAVFAAAAWGHRRSLTR